MGAAGGVLEAEGFDAVAEFAEGGGGGSAGEAGAGNDDRVLALVGRVTNFISNLALSHFCSIGPEGILESRFSAMVHSLPYFTNPARTTKGMETLPMPMM